MTSGELAELGRWSGVDGVASASSAMPEPGSLAWTEGIRTASITANFFTLLGASPVIGRSLRQDDGSETAPGAVIGFDLWRKRFGGDREIMGQVVELAGQRNAGDRHRASGPTITSTSV